MVNRKVSIIPSPELREWKLEKLIGRQGVIKASVKATTISGYWIKLNEPFVDELEWFIPRSSVQLLTNTGNGTTD